MSGSANALITASLAANRAASPCTWLRPRQSLISPAVKTLRRYRSPNAASESWTSSMATTSHPTRTRCPSTSPGKVIRYKIRGRNRTLRRPTATARGIMQTT